MEHHTVEVWTNDHPATVVITWQVEDFDQDRVTVLAVDQVLPGVGIWAWRRLHQVMTLAHTGGLGLAKLLLMEWAQQDSREPHLF